MTAELCQICVNRYAVSTAEDAVKLPLTQEKLRAQILNERNQGMDFGAHISSIDPICSAAVEAALVPILPNVYLGGAESGAKESTVVVKPVVCAVMVREQERREA